MGDEEGSSWLDDVQEEAPPPPVEAPHPKAAPAPAAGRPKRPSVAPATEVETPKKQLFKHWARPIFLQYEYLYNYRHNYYDDYIDYLDKRARGLEVRPPPPQTWAERALRTKTRDPYPYTSTLRLPRLSPDTQALLNTPHMSNTWHSVHSKDFYNRKYKSILF